MSTNLEQQLSQLSLRYQDNSRKVAPAVPPKPKKPQPEVKKSKTHVLLTFSIKSSNYTNTLLQFNSYHLPITYFDYEWSGFLVIEIIIFRFQEATVFRSQVNHLTAQCYKVWGLEGGCSGKQTLLQSAPSSKRRRECLRGSYCNILKPTTI